MDSDQRNKETQISTTRGVLSDSASSDEDDYGHTRTTMDKLLARALERQFTEVLRWVYRYSDAEIRRIDDRGECLDIVFRMPFYLPEPEYDYGTWLATRRAQSKLRRGFINHLRKREVVKDLSDYFFTKLAQYLLELNNISRYSKAIQKHLRRIAQKMLAGRRRHPIDKNIAKRIEREGVDIYRTIQQMQRCIERWKRTNPKIEDQAITKKIDRFYPIRNYPWMPFFTSLIRRLPCKPYFGSKNDLSNGVDEVGKPLPARLSEPNRWSTIDIAVKILQKKLLQESGLQFSLQDIKGLLIRAI